MVPLRVALITARFWPLVGGVENTMATLATGLRTRGDAPLIITARWHADWPQQAQYQGTPVVRLAPSPESRIGRLRYWAALHGWLRRHRRDLDVVCVSQLRMESYVTVGALSGSGVPVVLRAERAGINGDCQWQQTRRLGGWVRRRCRAAAALIGNGRAAHRELLAADFPSARVCLIDPGIAAGPPPRPLQRWEARAAIAEVNPDLLALEDTAVVVFVGRLTPEKRLLSLLRSWPSVLRRRPLTRLWLIGDGPQRETLYQAIRDLDLQHHVFMPGTFDDVRDVLTAANVFVYPADDEGVPRALLEAIAAGLPVVAADTADLRECPAIGPDHAALVPARDGQQLAEAIVRYLEHPPDEAILTGARRRVLQEFSVHRMVEQHSALFHSLIGRS
jgi:glycosyltransferase involved in cell wall biosynthesis